MRVTKDDDTGLDDQVFQYTIDGTGLHLTIQTDDPTKAGTHNLKLGAKRTDSNSWDSSLYADEFDFTVVIVDPCIDAVLTIDPTILSTTSLIYYIGS